MPRSIHPAARTARPAPAAPLPAYALYGEPQHAGLPDLLHLETIAARSRRHDWEIHPHRHEVLFQILVIASGSVQARLDADLHQLQGPCAISVPAMAMHGFRFAPSIDGMVITLAQQPLRALLAGQDAWRDAVLRLQALPTVGPDLLQAAQALRDEYAAAPGPWRPAALDTALRRLLLALARAAPPPAPPVAEAALPPRALQHVRRFQALVDAQFRQQPALAQLAAQLAITPTQLNRVCHRVLGHSALGVLHARLLLEAQRELGYTAMSVKQVAIGLGFADAGYFTRFFQRLTGQTPTGFRDQVHQGRPISSPHPSSPKGSP